jgi:hypothetical protein
MTHLKSSAETTKRLPENAEPFGKTRESDTEAGCVEATCVSGIVLGCVNPCFTAHEVSLISDDGSMVWEPVPCLPAKPSSCFFRRICSSREGETLFLFLVLH